MAKRSIWPWVVGVLVVAWLFGGDDESTRQSNPVEREVATPQPTSQPRSTQPQPLQVDRARPPQQSSEPVDGELAEPQQMFVTASRLNVRRAPGTEHKIIAALDRNAAVMVTKRAGEWRYVTGIRNPGWVHGDYLTTLEPAIRERASVRQPLVSGPSDSEIAQILIQQSIARYSGSCPCPYNTDRGGRRCGGRSAYSRPGGASPLCFAHDITPQMIARFRANQ